MNLPQPHENRLEGKWIEAGGRVVADQTALRIDELISLGLTKLATSKDGWDVLWVDERDGRMWELTYPHSDWHEGGPPALTHVTKEYVQAKYGLG